MLIQGKGSAETQKDTERRSWSGFLLGAAAVDLEGEKKTESDIIYDFLSFGAGCGRVAVSFCTVCRPLFNQSHPKF